MIIDWEYKPGKLVISYVNDQGNINVKYLPWNKTFKHMVTDMHDPNADPVYKTWDGKKIKKVPSNKPNRYSVFDYLDTLTSQEQDEIFTYKEPNIYFCDIETEIVDTGFVEPKDATTKVLTIALVHKSKCLLLGLKSIHRNKIFDITDEVNKRFEKFGTKFTVSYIDFSTYEKPEYEMLHYFFNKLMPKIPVITGWNFVKYDWTFLVNRARRVGVDPTIASPTGTLTSVSGFKEDCFEELPLHKVVVDYMELFAKWDTSIKIRESYSLDFVSEKMFGGEGKVHFTGGLQNLYEKDYSNYLFYNLVDTILVQMIHEKMKYINVMYAISSLSKIPALDALSALRVTEGLLRKDFKEKMNIILCREYDKSKGTLETVSGGYVKNPVIGLSKWVACYDFASLYPTTQRQNNIAPENYVGQAIEGNKFVEINKRKMPLDEDHVICANSAVFNRKYSVTCNKLKEIYEDRKKFKRMMLKSKDDLKKLETELENLNIN